MRRNIFLSLTLIALMAFPLAHVFAAGEVAIYTGEVNWITYETANKQAQICIDKLNEAGIPNTLFDSEDDRNALANWMQKVTGDGHLDVCILYGNFPSSIYPTDNALPDGSIAETFIETTDGDVFINHADYMFWGHSRNEQGGLQNMMDIADITMWGDHTAMTVTDEGKSIAPNLTDFVSHRPFHVDALAGDWAVEAVLAENHDGTRADPIIVRDGNRGRLIPIMQTLGNDNPHGAVAAEVISYLMTKAKTLDTTVTFLAVDVNEDGKVSIADVIEVAQALGKQVSEKPRADVNSDGSISFADLVAIARHIIKSKSGIAAAPWHKAIRLDAATVQTWLRLAQVEDDGSPMFREGIANLEQLLVSLLPKKTMLLANYPNPFNPETWIPYRLAKPAKVSIAIHAADGQLIRVLALGTQSAGMYQHRSRAAYWDGKNKVGEPVASGVYFYTLTAGDFNATRKMLIRK